MPEKEEKKLNEKHIAEQNKDIIEFADAFSKKMRAEKETFLEKSFQLINSKNENERVSFKGPIEADSLKTPEQCLAQLYVNAEKLSESAPATRDHKELATYLADKKDAMDNLEKIADAFGKQYDSYDIGNKSYNTGEYRTFQNGKDLIEDVNQFVDDCKRKTEEPLLSSEQKIDESRERYQKSSEKLEEAIDAFVSEHGDKNYSFRVSDAEQKIIPGSFQIDRVVDTELIIGSAKMYESESGMDDTGNVDYLIDETELKKSSMERAYDEAESRLERDIKKDLADVESKRDREVREIEKNYEGATEMFNELTKKLADFSDTQSAEYRAFRKAEDNLAKTDVSGVSPEHVIGKSGENAENVFGTENVGFYKKKSEEIGSKLDVIAEKQKQNEAELQSVNAEQSALEKQTVVKGTVKEPVDYTAEVKVIDEKLKVLSSGLAGKNDDSLGFADKFAQEAEKFPDIKKVFEASYNKAVDVLNAKDDFDKTLDKKTLNGVNDIKAAQDKFQKIFNEPKNKGKFGNIDEYFVPNLDKTADSLKNKGINAASDCKKLNDSLSVCSQGLSSLLGKLEKINDKKSAEPVRAFLEAINKNRDGVSKAADKAENVVLAQTDYKKNLKVSFAMMEVEKESLTKQRASFSSMTKTNMERAEQEKKQVQERFEKQTKEKEDKLAALGNRRTALEAENKQLAADSGYLTAVKDVLDKGKKWFSDPVHGDRKLLAETKSYMDKKQETISDIKKKYDTQEKNIAKKAEQAVGDLRHEADTARNFCERNIQTAKELKEDTKGLSKAVTALKKDAVDLATAKTAHQNKQIEERRKATAAHNSRMDALENQRSSMMDAVRKTTKTFGRDSELFKAIKDQMNAYEQASKTGIDGKKNNPQYKESRDNLETALSNYIKNRDTHQNKRTAAGQQRLDAIKSLYNNIQRQKLEEKNHDKTMTALSKGTGTVEPKNLMEAKILTSPDVTDRKVSLVDTVKLKSQMPKLETAEKDRIRTGERNKELPKPTLPTKKAPVVHEEEPSMGPR